MATPVHFGGGAMLGAPTPNIDSLAAGGLKLTSAYATPVCTPSRAALMTGRIPARSGLTRPLLASDKPTKNPWADEVTAAKLLSQNGYVTGLAGKWHIGEAKGMQPQDVGYDEFRGFLSVVSEYTQYMNLAKYSQLMLDPDRLKTFKGLSEYNGIVEGKKGGDLKIAYPLETPQQMGNVDQDFANFSVDFIKRAAAGQEAVLPDPRVRQSPFRQLSRRRLSGTQCRQAALQGRRGRGRRHRRPTDKNPGRNRAGRQHLRFLHVRQRPGGRFLSGLRLHAVPLRQGDDMGRRRPRARHCLLARHDQAGTRQRRPVRSHGFVQHLAGSGRHRGQDSDRALHRRRRPDGISARRRWRHQPSGRVLVQSGRFLGNPLGRTSKATSRSYSTEQPFSNISMSTYVPVAVAPWIFDIYRDPKERLTRSNGDYEWIYGPILQLQTAHAATFVKYPKKDIGLGLVAAAILANRYRWRRLPWGRASFTCRRVTYGSRRAGWHPSMDLISGLGPDCVKT